MNSANSTRSTIGRLSRRLITTLGALFSQAKASGSANVPSRNHMRTAKRIAGAASVILFLGSLSPITPTASAGDPCGLVYKGKYNDEWGWNWCVPAVPRIETRKPGWPDPRPPLTDRNSPYCRNTYIQTSYTPGQFAGGWYRTQKNQIRKTAWPDYYSIKFEYVITYKLSTGYWSGWVYPPGGFTRVMWVNCDVP